MKKLFFPTSAARFRHSVDCDLSCLIDTNTVVLIETFEGETRI